MKTKVDTTKNIKKDLLPSSRRLLQNPANMTCCKMKLELTKKIKPKLTNKNRIEIEKQKIKSKVDKMKKDRN